MDTRQIAKNRPAWERITSFALAVEVMDESQQKAPVAAKTQYDD